MIYRPAIARAVAQSALWRQDDHTVIRQNETLTTVLGATLNSQWESGQIWRAEARGKLGEIRWIAVRFQAEPSAEIEIQASADGGTNWVAASNTPALASTPEVGSDTLVSYFFGVVGHDLVFRVILPSDETALVLRWMAEIAVRSEWEYSHLV